MTISTQQYQDMRQELVVRLAANDPRAPNPSYGTLLNLFNQLITDSTGAAALSAARTAAMTARFREALTPANPALVNPNDAQVTDFMAQLAVDYAGAAAPNAAQYSIFLRSMAELLSPGSTLGNPSTVELYGYFANSFVFSYLGPIAGRSTYPAAALGPASVNAIMPMTCHVGTGRTLAAAKVKIVNFQGGAEVSSGGTIDVNAQIEYPPSTFTRLLFSGVALGTCANGGTLTSDLTTLTTPIPDNTAFVLHIRQESTVGIIFNSVFISSVANGDAATFNAADLTGTTFADTLGGAICFPVEIYGLTSLPTYGLIGDSLTNGAGDITSPNPSGDRGLIARSVGAGGRAYVNVAVSGETTGGFLANGTKRTALINSSGVTKVICSLGVNDIFTAPISLAQLQTNVIAIRALFPGIPFYQTTITPSTTSTDTWATTVNQTVRAQESVRVAFNTWLRAGGFTQATGYIEVANLYETAQNSGLIKVGTTLDGLHFTTASYSANIFALP
jgi:lysophospholipase L1-like esterase